MFKANSQEQGSIIWVLVFLVVAVWGLYTVSQRTNLFGVGDIDTSNDTSAALEVEAGEGGDSITKSFTTVNDYDTSSGKVVITNDKFRNSTLSIAAVMPSEFPGTYYQVKITGSDLTSDLLLGKLSKTDGFGSFKLDYELGRSISDYNQIIISVDGEAATVEGKTLPHNVMVLEL